MILSVSNEAELQAAKEFIEPFLTRPGGFSDLTADEDAELYRVTMLIDAYNESLLNK